MQGLKGFSIVALVALALSCSGDPQAQLNKLYKQQKALNEKIAMLEAESNNQKGDSVATNGVKVVASDLSPTVFNHFIEVQGKLDADKSVAIYAEAMGNIFAINVKAGEQVRKGQVLARIDDALVANSLRDLESNYSFVSEVYEKQKRLWEQQIGSEMQYLTAKNNKESLENKVAMVKDQLRMMTITAPVDGVLEDFNLKVGQSVNNMFPLFRIVNFTGVKVTAEVAEGYARYVEKGNRVQIFIPDLNKEYEGVVDFVGSYINPINRTFQVEVRMSRSFDNMKANMVAVVRINDYHAPKALVLPINVILNDSRASYVYVATEEEGRLIARRAVIETGITYNGLVEVTGGLSEGARVIVAGFQGLEDGKAIKL